MRQTLQSTISFSELLFSNIDGAFHSTREYTKKNIFSNFKLPKFNFDKKTLPKVILVLFTIILVGAVFYVISQSTHSTSANSNEKPFAPVALKTQDIKREFNFPIKDNNGKELSKMKYEVQKAVVQDEILVKGQRARAVEGRIFLIIDIKITNSFNQGLQINSRDYMRLIVNGNKEELVAADIHNDPVEVQAISTKTTRVGFPINETDRDLVLQIGEINGKKETIKLTVNN